MNRKKRRELVAGLTQLQAEGQGLFRIEFVRCSDGLALMRAIAEGDAGAIRTASLIGQFVRMIRAADPAALCLLCDSAFSSAVLPPTILIMRALRDDPGVALVNGLCDECETKPELHAAVLVKYRESLIPDLRRLPPFAEPGRA